MQIALEGTLDAEVEAADASNRRYTLQYFLNFLVSKKAREMYSGYLDVNGGVDTCETDYLSRHQTIYRAPQFGD